MFVTCLYAILDPVSGRLRYANAGHDLPYRRHGDGAVELRATGMPLGLLPGMGYEEHESVLEPGDTVLFYSDGIVEAHNAQREMFSFGRLQSLVGGHAGGASLIDHLLMELARFTGAGWEQEDDVTMVTLQRAAVSPVGRGQRVRRRRGAGASWPLSAGPARRATNAWPWPRWLRSCSRWGSRRRGWSV